MPFNRYALIGLRVSNKTSVYTLAWDTLIDASVINRIESGLTQNPSYLVVQTIADYFKVNVEIFIVP